MPPPVPSLASTPNDAAALLWTPLLLQIGPVKVGSEHPIALQTMTTTDTRDVEKTVEQVGAGLAPPPALCPARRGVAGALLSALGGAAWTVAGPCTAGCLHASFQTQLLQHADASAALRSGPEV